MFLQKIVPRDIITQRADEQLQKPHFGIITLMIFAFVIPTVSWAVQLNAALNQPNNYVSLENYTETGDMF